MSTSHYSVERTVTGWAAEWKTGVTAALKTLHRAVQTGGACGHSAIPAFYFLSAAAEADARAFAQARDAIWLLERSGG